MAKCHAIFDAAKRAAPIVIYLDECWFYSYCLEHFSLTNAINMGDPLNQKLGYWVVSV
jgi:hypothetical protein